MSEFPTFKAHSIKLLPEELIESSASFFSSSSLISFIEERAVLNKLTLPLSFDEFIILKKIFSCLSSFLDSSNFSPILWITCSHKEFYPSPTRYIKGVTFSLF